MQPAYLIRIDDVHPRMNWGKFAQLRTVLERHNVHPIVGIIPDCKFSSFNQTTPTAHFWAEMRGLQSMGWAIAMHGCHHTPNTGDSGLLGICECSEFAGLAYSVQLSLLKKGRDLLHEQGLCIDLFMAPWHTFDKHTIRGLLEVDINIITDGYGLTPHVRSGMTFLPQQVDRPRAMPFGIMTFVYHPDGTTESDLVFLDSFLKSQKNYITSMNDALKYVLPPYMKVVDAGFGMALKCYRTARRLAGCTPVMNYGDSSLIGN